MRKVRTPGTCTCQEHVGDFNIAAVVEPQEHWPFGQAVMPGQFFEEMDGAGITVDSTPAGDGDVFDAFGVNQAVVQGLGVRALLPNVGVVGYVLTAQYRRAGGEVKDHVALQKNGPGQESPWRHEDPASATSGAGVDGRLNRFRVERDAVTAGAQGSDIEHILGEPAFGGPGWRLRGCRRGSE